MEEDDGQKIETSEQPIEQATSASATQLETSKAKPTIVKEETETKAQTESETKLETKTEVAPAPSVTTENTTNNDATGNVQAINEKQANEQDTQNTAGDTNQVNKSLDAVGKFLRITSLLAGWAFYGFAAGLLYKISHNILDGSYYSNYERSATAWLLTAFSISAILHIVLTWFAENKHLKQQKVPIFYCVGLGLGASISLFSVILPLFTSLMGVNNDINISAQIIASFISILLFVFAILVQLNTKIVIHRTAYAIITSSIAFILIAATLAVGLPNFRDIMTMRNLNTINKSVKKYAKTNNHLPEDKDDLATFQGTSESTKKILKSSNYKYMKQNSNEYQVCGLFFTEPDDTQELEYNERKKIPYSYSYDNYNDYEGDGRIRCKTYDIQELINSDEDEEEYDSEDDEEYDEEDEEDEEYKDEEYEDEEY